MRVLVLNGGSSSLKCKLFDMATGRVVYQKTVEHIGEKGGVASFGEALELLDVDFAALDAIGHRVVHGGEMFHKSVVIDAEVLAKLQTLIPLAPLHNPANIEGIRAAMQKAPNTQQIAVFDTAFHTTMPQEAFLYAIKKELYTQHAVRRYGFHGTSHSYLTKEAAKILNKRVDEVNLITLHLGNGASACAVQKGKSIDTSMGFTPLEGLVMGTRCGDIDAAIVLYLQRELGLRVDEVDTLLNKHAGLMGMCGDNDMRAILQRDDEDATLAVAIMVRRIQKYIGAYMVLLEGEVDAIVFSGGIGEHATQITQAVMENKMFQKRKFLVIPTQEELEIAYECFRLVGTL